MPDYSERRKKYGNSKYDLAVEPNDGYVTAPKPSIDTTRTSVGKHPNEGGMDKPTSVQSWQKKQMSKHVKS